MEVRILEKGKDRVSFILKGATPTFANTIRRIALTEVPTMAIEDVEFRKNSSVLYDEMIAHRLGLIPIKTDLKSYNLPEECKCKGKGCNRCTLKMTLKVKGAGIVHASEIKSRDKKVKPVYPETPIVKLLKGQALELEATAVLGYGKDHSKWSPGLIYYKYRPLIEVKGCNNCGECVKACPQNVFEIKKGKIVVNKDNVLKCHLCEACTDACKKGAIKLNESEEDFIFYVESWGQLKPTEIVKTAADIFAKKFDQFAKLMKKA